jgi:tetratricopeptide (TPR) repeat protein
MSAVAAVELEAAPASGALNLVDDQHPWLGLDSFSEETRQYFHGREEEVGELARRVQRKTLSVLFGQSGLGKTSILRAGIVPRLRKEGFCPVYVRIDYSRESPAPSQQIKQAIFRATEALGKWTRPGSAVPGESLWEFLHHRDDILVDERGNTLIPLLIFDQFEEIFTLGQMDDFGRARAAEFIEDLADLVENRPPRAIEAMLDVEDSIVERFDFNRADYRILIALREDYLAHLEGLKGSMPSITQNRMRLARMTGHQALAAVVKPGGKLVSEEVAEAIVRYVAGGSELRNAEVEPSLLSLVCRELNNARIAQNRPEISADLLAGSRDTILNEFYERALVDQPPRVRRFIEDEMLTDSGFRESLAEERVLKGLADANAMPNALPLLVNRRLLRIEERLDTRRVELTHDVLCAVVKASRDARREREAREEAERQLAAQREREEATKRSLVRTRYVAAGCAVLALGALVSAIFGYTSMKRAQEAEAKSEATRTMAENARTESEKLIVYLLDDFYLELEPVGRLDVVADLSRRALAYYASLPPELRTPQTERNRALAQVRLGYVLRYQSKLDEGGKVLTEANATLARLRKQGDTSEAAAIGHALGLSAQGRVVESQGRQPEALVLADESVKVLAPLMGTATPSVALRRAYGSANTYLGFIRLRTGQQEPAVRDLEAARESYRSIDGLQVGDLASAAGYAEASSWLMDTYEQLGRSADGRKVGEEGYVVASRVLEKRPGHMNALRSRALISSALARIEFWDLKPSRGLPRAEGAIRDWEALVKADPGNNIARYNMHVGMLMKAWGLQARGDITAAIAAIQPGAEVEKVAEAQRASNLYGMLATLAGWRAEWHALLGHRQEAHALLLEMRRHGNKALAFLSPDAFGRKFLPESGQRFDFATFESEDDFARLRDAATVSAARLGEIQTASEGQARAKNQSIARAYYYLALAQNGLRNFAAAEKASRDSLRYHAMRPGVSREDALDKAAVQTQLALALARQGQLNEARAAVEPALAFHRQLRVAGSEDADQQLQLATSLYVAALANPSQAAGLLPEAARIVSELPREAPKRRDAIRLRGWIAEEMARRGSST